MARRKKVAEEPEEPVEPSVDYQQIQETPIEELVGPVDTKAEEEIKAEEAPVPPKEEAPEEVEIEWDPKVFEEEMTKKMGQVSEESAKKILEQVTKEKEPAKETVEELKSPWAKEGRTPKDYEEIADWAVEKKAILDERKAKLAAAESAAQTEAQRAANEAEVTKYNQFVDMQINELIADKKIPAVDNSLNPEDPGIVARKQLFQKMLDVNMDRQKAGKPPVYSVKEIYYEHFANVPKEEEEEPAGADAPVSPGKAAPTAEAPQIDYIRDVKRKSMLDILMGK